ncbi:SET domain-containing protein [Aureococcus anophagefferens]|nr:SET domain-containing protein [Aureococcus anophagefferens]
MVVIKQSFKAFLTKHKLDDAPAARAPTTTMTTGRAKSSVALETGIAAAPGRAKFMISAEGQPARAAGAERAGRRRVLDGGRRRRRQPAEPAEAYRVVHAVVMVARVGLRAAWASSAPATSSAAAS